MDKVIERAYQLINEPIDPNLRVPLAIEEIVNYREAEAGETVEYFASSAQDRAADAIYVAAADGQITYVKVALKTTTSLTFVGLQSKLETVLIDEILNSKDQTALAQKKDAIIRAMDNEEVRLCLNLVLASASQEVTKLTSEDLLDVIIKMKEKISKYATDYILLVAADVNDEIESYDKDNVATFNYSFPIADQLKRMGINKVVKVVGDSGIAGGSSPVLADGKAILIGRNSQLAKGKPIFFTRRKFSAEIAELSGAKEGAVRLISVANTPIPVNAGASNTLGYSVFGYESKIQVLTNYRAVAWSDEIIS